MEKDGDEGEGGPGEAERQEAAARGASGKEFRAGDGKEELSVERARTKLRVMQVASSGGGESAGGWGHVWRGQVSW